MAKSVLSQPEELSLTLAKIELLRDLNQLTPAEIRVTTGILRHRFASVAFHSDLAQLQARYDLIAIEVSLVASVFAKLDQTIQALSFRPIHTPFI